MGRNLSLEVESLAKAHVILRFCPSLLTFLTACTSSSQGQSLCAYPVTPYTAIFPPSAPPHFCFQGYCYLNLSLTPTALNSSGAVVGYDAYVSPVDTLVGFLRTNGVTTTISGATALGSYCATRSQ